MKKLLGNIKRFFTASCDTNSTGKTEYEKRMEDYKDLRTSLGIIGDPHPTENDLTVFNFLISSVKNDSIIYKKEGNGKIFPSEVSRIYGSDSHFEFELKGVVYKVVESSHYFGMYMIGHSYQVYADKKSFFSSDIVSTVYGKELFKLIETKADTINNEINKIREKKELRQKEITQKQTTDKIINSIKSYN